METVINPLIDITYKSELILDTNTMTYNFESYVSRINSQTPYGLQLTLLWM